MARTFDIFAWTWNIWRYRVYIKTKKNGDFCEELLSENDFEVVLTVCYDHGANASKAVQKTVADQKKYYKWSSFNLWCSDS